MITSLSADSPEVLLFRAVVERPAVRIENEMASEVTIAPPEEAAAYRARQIVILGAGAPDRAPAPVRALAERLRASGQTFLFVPDVWLRGQAVGLFWTNEAEDLLPALQREQNRLYQAIDRATFATVRARLLSLPHDPLGERRLRPVLGADLRVPRGYDVLVNPAMGAACLVNEGPPTRLLRIRALPKTPAAPAADLRVEREQLARTFRPDERTLDILDPTLVPNEMAGARRGLHGRWEDGRVSAAGPYRFYEIARGDRRFQVDLAVFAPGRPKLPYLRELQAIAETLTPR